MDALSQIATIASISAGEEFRIMFHCYGEEFNVTFLRDCVKCLVFEYFDELIFARTGENCPYGNVKVFSGGLVVIDELCKKIILVRGAYFITLLAITDKSSEPFAPILILI